MEQKVLILGSRGQLGRTVRDEIAHCFFVRGIFCPSRKQLDITDKEALLAYVKRFQIDTIINCAAYTNVKGAETDYEGAYAVNVKAIENLCATDCKIIHISTDYVFDGEKGDFYTEEDDTNPLNVYGKTKREGEEILMKLKPDSIIIRTSWLYSKFNNNFLSNMVKKIIEQDEVFVVNDQYGAPTSCYSLASCICEFLDYSYTSSGIYHFSDEGPCSWFQFALKINKLLIESKNFNVNEIKVKPISSSEFNDTVKRPKFSAFSLKKIKEHGIPVWEWEDALEYYFENFIEHQEY
jgi:dTDP-4-dehydrorhamnose reductase